ncbi:MAG: permease prefix domain 1-containing protein [Mariniblastus sp.]|nr:permease prefix domain 1-containing protein [Mariniblastus sp.]
MTHQEFENYLALVSRLLRLSRAERDAIGLELRDHLELRVAELKAMGHSIPDATRQALEEFGDAAALAQQFQLISRSYQRRWMMRFAVLCSAFVFAGLVFLMAMWPESARFGTPNHSFAQQEVDAKHVAAVAATRIEGNLELSETTRRNRLIDEKLNESVEWGFDEVPFREVRQLLAEQLGVNVFLDESAEHDSLVDDEPVTFQATRLPGRDALKLMLKRYNATYVVQRGVLSVISLDVATSPEYFRRKIFNCDGIFASDQGCGEDELIALIKKVVEPENWLETNGDASATVVGDLLVVLATESMLDQVGDLLRDLEHDMNRTRDSFSDDEEVYK